MYRIEDIYKTRNDEPYFRKVFGGVHNGSTTEGLQTVGYNIITKKVNGIYAYEKVMDDREKPITDYMDEINKILPRNDNAFDFLSGFMNLLKQLDAGRLEVIKLPFLCINTRLDSPVHEKRAKKLGKVKRVLNFKLADGLFNYNCFGFPGSIPFSTLEQVPVTPPTPGLIQVVQFGDPNVFILVSPDHKEKLRDCLVKELKLTDNNKPVNEIIEKEKIFFITPHKLSNWGVHISMEVLDPLEMAKGFMMFDPEATKFVVNAGYNLTRM